MLLTIVFIIALGAITATLHNDAAHDESLQDYYRAEYRRSYPVGF